jgi:hypothetical protein
MIRLKIWLFNYLYKSIASLGDSGDTELAHINKKEQELLLSVGGSGTINQRTGLLEFKGGGGSETPEPTAEENEMARISAEKWNNFVNSGIPAQNEAIKMMTADLLDGNGNIKVDSTSSIAATEKAYSKQPINPNQQGVLANIEAEKMNTSALVGQNENVKQMEQFHKGLTNTLRIGKGQELEALQSKQQMSNSAHNTALQDYKNKMQSKSNLRNSLFTGAGALTRSFGGNMFNKEKQNSLSGFINNGQDVNGNYWDNQ